jgi:hypothetical protein
VEWRIEFVEGPFEVIVTTSGEATGDAFDEMRTAIFKDPRYTPGSSMLIDHTQLDMSGLSSDDIRRIADSDKGRYDADRPDRLVAIVVQQKAWYGLARMWQAHYGDGDGAAHTRVVTSREDAYEWAEGGPQ